jgi:hypothetical protein
VAGRKARAIFLSFGSAGFTPAFGRVEGVLGWVLLPGLKRVLKKVDPDEKYVPQRLKP